MQCKRSRTCTIKGDCLPKRSKQNGTQYVHKDRTGSIYFKSNMFQSMKTENRIGRHSHNVHRPTVVRLRQEYRGSLTSCQLTTCVSPSLISSRHTNKDANIVYWSCPCGVLNHFISPTSMGQKSFSCHHYHFPEGETDTNAVPSLCEAQYKLHDSLLMEWDKTGLTDYNLSLS